MDPGAKKAPDPGSGSVTLLVTTLVFLFISDLEACIRILSTARKRELKNPNDDQVASNVRVGFPSPISLFQL